MVVLLFSPPSSTCRFIHHRQPVVSRHAILKPSFFSSGHCAVVNPSSGRAVANVKISSIIAKTQISGNSTNCTSTGNIRDFCILKAFNIKVNPPKAPVIIEVLWQPPILHWFKCNTDGAALGAPGQAACGGIFRDSTGDYIGCFADKLGIENAFIAELVAAMKAIEIAFTNGCHKLWLETDSR
ncbi:hypothetical protein TSUD_57940 [Trifolium subterraneum]|uniref:RNase H type-1 domain-containing protein n=1 Tax=Trifolium subterraneum TaxID=3900 RepID=A0A2Z6N054_TRISU|nr:hypothetical protein TSUD_57940 [Trifolium subterraneum]